MNAALMDPNLHYYWVRRGLTREQARAARDLPTTLEVRDRAVVLFVSLPAFNVRLDDLWMFPALAEALERFVRAPRASRAWDTAGGTHTWLTARAAPDGSLVLKDFAGDAPVPGLSEALLACL